ncbi:MAG: WG repeat-containing protein [candidate division WOR-3 bacterium]|nr:MAG: WG repeat-containing protein [candidate division WOR-3 bacterium]
MDRRGRAVIDPQFRRAFQFSEGFAFVRLQDRRWCGYIDEMGRMAIGPTRDWSYGQPFSEGRAAVWSSKRRPWSGRRINGSLVATGPAQYIDRTGRYITDHWYEGCFDFSEGIGCAFDSAGAVGIDRSGKVLFHRPLRVHPFSEGLAAALSNSSGVFVYGYVDRTGRMVIPPRRGQLSVPFREGLALVIDYIRGVSTGYMDRSGRQVLSTTYRTKDKEAGCFYEGLAVVKDDSGWFHIDHSGRPQYGERWAKARRFSEGLAAVSVVDSAGSGRWGYIDRAGRVQIFLNFREAFEFNGGIAQVVLDGNSWCYVDRQGDLFGVP